jgi:archaellum component FlaC
MTDAFLDKLQQIREEMEERQRNYKKIQMNMDGYKGRKFYILKNNLLVESDYKDVRKHVDKKLRGLSNEITKIDKYSKESA